MKKLIIAACLVLTGCSSNANYPYHKATGMEQSGVGTAYGIGFSYSRPTGNGRELTQDELKYIEANKVDFAAVQRENEKANAEIYAQEKARLKERNKITCEDIAAIGYQVLVNKAWEGGDWKAVDNYNTQRVIDQCNANRGQ